MDQRATPDASPEQHAAAETHRALLRAAHALVDAEAGGTAAPELRAAVVDAATAYLRATVEAVHAGNRIDFRVFMPAPPAAASG